MASRDVYLVIGGSGFVGRHIVQQLLARGDAVSVFDIVQRHHDVPFYSGDITEQGEVAAAVRKSGATCIIHTASPHATLKNPALYWKVNVEGTKAVIAAAQATGVRKLVYTSSAGVVFNGGDIVDIDERLPPPDEALDSYNHSKAVAEAAVLAANGEGGLLTVALRPAGIFGEGDRQAMTGLYQVYERNQTHFQIGGNTNLFDWTYVGNVAHAHLLAADKLVSIPPLKDESDVDSLRTLTPEDEDLISYPLPSIDLTTGKHRIPTCQARPLGPYVTPPPNAQAIEAAFDTPNPPMSKRPVVRSPFDQFTPKAIVRRETNPLQVAGQAFFITNGEPVYFWDFPRAVWTLLDAHLPTKRPKKRLIVLPRAIGLAAATGAELWGRLTGKEPTFTRYKVSYSCATRWHNIEKARRILGYEPQVGVEEGIARMVKWWLEENGHATPA